jgi:probable F420-dependent oxidoreductase
MHRPETPWLEPLALLGAVAAATSHVRLSTGVLLSPLRSAVLLAKSLATLDVLSEGRLEPGIGTGWQRGEYAASELDWARRYQLLDDGVRACRRLWAEQPCTFRSATVNFDEVWSLPAPIQARIPILYGVAATARNVRRIAELGDGWCPVRVTADDVRRGVDSLREAFAAAGRSSDDLIVRVHATNQFRDDGSFDADATLESAVTLLEAGATVIGLVLPAGLADPAAAARLIADVAVASRRFPDILT